MLTAPNLYDEYIGNAVKAEAMAELFPNPIYRDGWLTIARRYRSLAEELEKSSKPRAVCA